MNNEATTSYHGSNPCRTATFPEENEGFVQSRTTSAQNKPESDTEPGNPPVKFPKTLTNKKTKAKVTIYGKKKTYSFYRVCWRVDGERKMKSFQAYSEAKHYADTLLGQLSKGSRVTALTPGQANDALAAYERLQRYYVATGRKLSLFAAVSDYAESAGRLPDHTLADAIDGFLNSVAKVQRKDLKEAVDQFIESRKAKTLAENGKRPRISPEHHYNTSIWLREFAATFPGHAVCDLAKNHLTLYMEKHGKASPKTRNERRGVVKMLLKWCVEKDYLAPTHRLFETSEMAKENAQPEEIELYTPGEFRLLLERANKIPEMVPSKEKPDQEEMQADYRELLPLLALAGLAGMRLREIMRLDWKDVFHQSGCIEVKAHKSKTRSRRLIPICASLLAWLQPYRERTGRLWSKSYDMFHIDFAALRKELEIPNRRNGLRHAFVSAHYAAHSDEGLTAQQAGNSPDMIHQHYKGLMTKEQGEAWFAVSPGEPANVISLRGRVAKTRA